MATNEKSFEERLEDVQNMIARIEEGKLPLEDSVRQYEEGMNLLNQLDRELEEMNRRITVLQKGEEQEKPLEDGGAE